MCVKATLNYRFLSHSIVVIAHKFTWFSTPDELMFCICSSWMHWCRADIQRKARNLRLVSYLGNANDKANEEVSQFLAWNSLEIKMKCHWTFTASQKHVVIGIFKMFTCMFIIHLLGHVRVRVTSHFSTNKFKLLFLSGIQKISTVLFEKYPNVTYMILIHLIWSPITW